MKREIAKLNYKENFLDPKTAKALAFGYAMGMCTNLIFLLVFSFLFSENINFSAALVKLVATLAAVLGEFAGSYFCAGTLKRGRPLACCLICALAMFITISVSEILFIGQPISKKLILKLISALISGAIGGILGNKSAKGNKPFV